MKKSLFIVLMMFIASLAHADKPVVVVMDFLSTEVPKDIVKKTAELLRIDLMNTGEIEVLMRSQSVNTLKGKGLRFEQCGDVSGAGKAGKALGADRAIVGSLMALGKQIIISCVIVDVEKGRSERSIRMTCESEDKLGDTVTKLSKQILKKIDVRGIARKKSLEMARKKEELEAKKKEKEKAESAVGRDDAAKKTAVISMLDKKSADEPGLDLTGNWRPVHAAGNVTFYNTGICIYKGFLIVTISGKWSCTDIKKRIFSIVWDHGYTDTVTLSLDGQRLEGVNNNGDPVSFVRNN